MCLDKIDKVTRKRGGTGYKIVKRTGEEFVLGIVGCYKSTLTSKGKWSTDKNNEDIWSGRRSGWYRPGFHVFQSVAGLKKFRNGYGWHDHQVVKVQFKDVVASGYQTDVSITSELNSIRVIVARRVKIIEEITLDSN